MQLSLKALRVNSGYTQQDVADIFEVSRQTVMNWENGKEKRYFVDDVVQRLWDERITA